MLAEHWSFNEFDVSWNSCEIFAAQLGRQALRFLRGETARPCFFDWSAQHLFCRFAERWLMASAERMPEYREYDREQYRLWPKSK